MTIFHNVNTRPHLLFFVLYAISIGIFSIIAYQQVRFTSESQAYVFGSTLAAQAASQASEILVSNDRLSLSVMLNQLSANPYIAAVNVYSIENKLLAGREFSNGAVGHIFTAPVHYQEVIAGYVRVRLNDSHIEKPARDAITMVLFAALLLLTTCALIIRYIQQRATNPTQQLISHLENKDTDAIALKASTETGDWQRVYQQLSPLLPTPAAPKPDSHIEEDIPEDSDSLVTLCVRLNNQPTLQQCMNPADFEKLLNSQLKALRQAAKLYNGELQYSAEGQAYLSFPATFNQDFLFSATCCALLLERLSLWRKQQHLPTFSLGLGMSYQDQQQEQNEHPFLIATAASSAYTLALHDHRSGVAITPEVAQHLKDEPRVVIENTQEPFYRITQVHSNYQHLLEQQCRQITHHDTVTPAD